MNWYWIRSAEILINSLADILPQLEQFSRTELPGDRLQFTKMISDVLLTFINILINNLHINKTIAHKMLFSEGIFKYLYSYTSFLLLGKSNNWCMR